MMNLKRTHQVFSAAIRAVGVDALAQIWGKSRRTIYRWAADPKFSGDRGRSEDQEPLKDPVQCLVETLEEAQSLGEHRMVEGTLKLIGTSLGYEFQPAGKGVRSDRKSSGLELMDVTCALGGVANRLRDALTDGELDEEERTELCALASVLIRESMQLKDALCRGEK